MTLEKKAEETFGFEIQVGAVPCCAVPRSPPCQPAPCFAWRGIFKLSLSHGLFLAVTELPAYRSLPWWGWRGGGGTHRRALPGGAGIWCKCPQSQGSSPRCCLNIEFPPPRPCGFCRGETLFVFF